MQIYIYFSSRITVYARLNRKN